ncbi:MAG: lipoate--protein ligase [Eubacteriales bacterium]|nr:lipoate--protein ligase [Eubacteriales bacterium]
MIYIENNKTDPAYNLAFEEYVFSRMNFSDPVLLLWQNGPAVIVGKYQNTIEEINYDFVQDNKISVIRRNTGGGAVYHDLGNLNYSFIIPEAQTKVDFKTFTIPIVKALQSCGINAVQTGRNDILVDGQKFSGNAQQFRNHRLLHHGTLMFDVNMEDVAKALKVKPGKFKSKATKSVRSRVTNLKPFFKESDIESTQDLKAMLLDWFDKEYGLKRVELTEKQHEEVLALREEKYGTDEWNYGNSPKANVVRGDFFRCGQIEFHFIIDKHKIKYVKIMGDFFSTRDVSELEKIIVGADYERESILQILREAELDAYFGEVTAEELVDVIV